MAATKKISVPAIPLAALDAIRDLNTRSVLQALVDGHHVRNGQSGTGDERFVTARELGLINGNTKILVGTGQDGPNSAPTFIIPPAQIGRIINDLQAAVIESQLFKELGERVDLIDKPGGLFDRVEATEIVVANEIIQRKSADEAIVQSVTILGARVGNNEAAILTEQQARVNADNAITTSVTTQFAQVGQSLSLVQQSVSTVSNRVSSLSSQVSQVQASVDGNTAAIKQEAEARVNADGVINAKYTVKIDVNGYVTGYGLMSTANNSVPFSEFIVRADRFAIGSSAGPGITPRVPFIVTTTTSTVGGQSVPPGVYIDSAVIQNGSIANAKIGNAAIDTLKVAGNSITTGTFIKGGASSVPASGEQVLMSRTINLGDDFNTGLIAIASVSIDAAANATYGLRIIIDGGVAGDERASLSSGFAQLGTIEGFAARASRLCNVQLVAYNPSSGGGSGVALNVNSSSMAIFGGKR